MINRGLFLFVLVLTSSSGSAGILNCATLKASVESKLKANKVRHYSLDIVSADQNVGEEVGRIVGSCNNRLQKIVYARLAKPLGEGEASVPELPSAVSVSRVDARGFIDVWAFRKDVIAVSSTARGQDECSRGEGDDDEEYLAGLKTRRARLAYERKRRKEDALARKAEARCERANLTQSVKFEQLQAAFNTRWLPVLRSATQLGDPVAEVVLRLCETTSLLDRSAIAADCSEKAEDKEFARQRLKTIDFKPALHSYTTTDHGQELHMRQSTCDQDDPGSGTECAFRADIARYERILSVMRSGYLSVAESWNTCQIGDQDPAKDKLAEECQRLMNLMIAVSAGVNRFYAAGPIQGGVEGLHHLTLQRPILRGEYAVPWYEWPYDKRGIVTRNDRRAFSDANFQHKFYTELDRTVQQIETNIADDLRREPRWAVFLVERLAGKIYDAMDMENPNKPTSADIAKFEANSPRSQAIRKEQEIERLKTISYLDLIASLRTSRNPKLHYVWDHFPLNLQELGRRPADVAALVTAYHAEKDDEVFRFNIIMILNHKSEQSFSTEETKLIKQCFVDALSDSSSMVRAEAAWRASMVGDQINNPAVKQLILKGRQDEQENLLKELPQ